MNLRQLWNQALVNLTAAKLRSFLAVLGILVGTAAVVALLSCGQLATEKALEQFKSLGTNLLAVTVFQKAQDQSSSENSMSLSQWEQMKDKIPQIKYLAAYSTAYQPISFRGKILQGAIIAADENLAQIIKVSLEKGHFVSFVDTFEHFCVIGHSFAQQIKTKNDENLIGTQIRIGQSLYTIIGIANPWNESGFFNEDINQAVIIPLAGRQLINKDSKINNVVIELQADSSIEPVIANIKTYILSLSEKFNIFTRSAKQIVASMETQGHIFTLLLAIIGGISLLVGGIGVMNVMLVSVSERKKEIGVRKAVGAKSRDIQYLFLLESLMLSLIGGLLGVFLGLCFTWIVAWFSHWNFTIYLIPPCAGFFVSALTGIFFGFYPAKRAAKLQPVICLRSE